MLLFLGIDSKVIENNYHSPQTGLIYVDRIRVSNEQDSLSKVNASKMNECSNVKLLLVSENSARVALKQGRAALKQCCISGCY